MKKIIFIGAGNLATQLSSAMKEQGYDIIQIYSKSLKNAKILGSSLSCDYTDDLNQIKDTADLYIFSIIHHLICFLSLCFLPINLKNQRQE